MARKFAVGMVLLMTGLAMIASGLAIKIRPARAAIAEAAVAGAAPAGAFLGADPDNLDELIRLHVVANSDSEADQALKRAVRDAILDEVTPLFVHVTTPAEARLAITGALPRIEAAARRVVAVEGYDYPVRTELGRFDFPGKAYGTLWLPAGNYTALKVQIGQAAGANWWCVLFPPMCFVDWSTGVVLEPKSGTGGKTTVTTPRRHAPALADEAALKKMPAKPRLAVLDWLKGRNAR